MVKKSPAVRVMVVGSINVDLVMQVPTLPIPGETVGNGKFFQYMGGKGANQAVAAARAGAEVMFVGAVGKDSFGEQAIANLSAHGINTDSVSVINNEATGTALIFVDDNGENSIGVAPGANHQLSIEGGGEFTQLISQCDVVLLQLEIPIDIVGKVIGIAHRHGVKTVINAAPCVPISTASLQKTDVLIVNETEALQLSGLENRKASREEVTAALQDSGVNNVVTTLGAAGVHVATDKMHANLPGHQVEVIDTTGAGDTFCGAFTTMYIESSDVLVAAVFAQKAAALSVGRLGAQTAIPDRAEIESFE